MTPPARAFEAKVELMAWMEPFMELSRRERRRQGRVCSLDSRSWRSAHGDEKGHGLCHGASGNGFALLTASARTGDEHWLERARRFAVHALAQAERIAAANGHRRYSLFNGDIGTALFAAACLDADPRFAIVDVM